MADLQKLILTNNSDRNLMSKSLYGGGSQTNLGETQTSLLRKSNARDSLFDFGGVDNGRVSQS